MPEAAGQCPACLRGVRPGTGFCPGCGQTLGAASAVAPSGGGARSAAAARFAEHWGELKAVLWLFGLLLASSFVTGLASRADPSPWPWVAATAADAAIVLVAAGLRWRRLVFLFKLHAAGARRALELAAASLVFFAAMGGYFAVLKSLGVPFSSATGPFAQAGWPLWTMVMMISVAPALFEELAFRGVIQSSLERVFNARDAWLIQAALFSVLHLSPLVFPSHFLMGLWFGHLRMRTRSLYPGMLVHGAWNAFVALEELAG